MLTQASRLITAEMLEYKSLIKLTDCMANTCIYILKMISNNCVNSRLEQKSLKKL